MKKIQTINFKLHKFKLSEKLLFLVKIFYLNALIPHQKNYFTSFIPY